MFSGSLCRRTGWLVAALLLAASARAGAVPCSTLPSPVYIAGTTTGAPMIQQIAARMADSSVTYVFQKRDSCDAVRAIATHLDGSCSGTDCMVGTAEYYTASANTSGGIDTQTCDITTPHTIDIALSDFFLSKCAPGTDPAEVADVTGPVRPIVFVTPKPTPGVTFPRSITAAEAYMVFGFDVGNAPPWTEPANLYLPGADSTTEQVLSMFLHIPVDQFSAQQEGGEQGVLDAMNQAMCVDRSRVLGVVGTDFYDLHRGTELAALAYADPNESYAYTPDYNSYPNYSQFPSAYLNTTDKQNVRDGHYPLWSYLHMVALADPQTAEPKNAEAVRIEHFFYGTDPVGTTHDSYSVFNGAVDSGLVPQCAMTVARTEDAGDLAPYSDFTPCGCAFAATSPGSMTPDGCVACSINADCGSGHVCRYNFCEAR